MKFFCHPSLFVVLVGIFLWSSPSMAAATFGGPQLVVNVNGVNYTYNWSTSNNASPQRIDTYRGVPIIPAYFLTVTGLVASPTLATVTGTRGSVQINGYLQNGTYYDNPTQTSTASTSLTFRNVTYTSVTTTTTKVISLSAGTVTPSTTQVYTGSGATIYVAADGTVSGSEQGYFVDGNWYLNNVVNSDANLTLPNGHLYTSYTYYTNYVRNGGQIAAVVTQQYNNYNQGRQFTIAADGTISGSEEGVFLNGSWYVNYAHDTVQVDLLPPGMENYKYRTLLTAYALDGAGGVSSTVSESYSASETYYPPAEGFKVDANGRITGDITGYRLNNNWYINGNKTLPTSGLRSIDLMGQTYTFTDGSASYTLDSQNNPASTNWVDNYFNYGDYGNGGVQITYSWTAGSAQATQILSGSEYYVGSFSADFSGGINNLVWQPRTAPSFCSPTLYLNGTLLNWQSSTIDATRFVTDTYGPNTDGNTLVIKGSLSGFIQRANVADVSVNGASVGSYTQNQMSVPSFSVGGWDVEVSAPNRDTPLFSSATLWVDGTAYAFSHGYGDEYGNSKDVYLASGGTVSINGRMPSATVQVTHNGQTHSGSGDFTGGGSFTVPGVDISAVPPEGGPVAFWVGNTFYRRTAGSNDYVSFPVAGDHLSLGGTNASSMRVLGTHDGISFTGTFDSTAGVFTFNELQAGNIVTFVGCQAKTDGTQIPSGAAPLYFPPAVRIGSEVLDYLGMTTGNNAAAYYGDARHAVYGSDPTAPPLYGDGGRRVLAIRMDPNGIGQNVVTLTDYRTGTSTVGIYWLNMFQTGTTNSLPMPIYGVDPNANDMPWSLSPVLPQGSGGAGSGPATLLVGNQVWRFSFSSSEGATYLGYYEGQRLVLGAPNAGGIRTVTVTDPVNGDATGMLNDASGSTTLSNGQTINTGTSTGAPAQPQNLATVTGDLNIPGSSISMGTLIGDTTTSGATLQFSDNGTQAMFGSALGRSAAQWVWWRVDPANAQGFVPTMVVDSAFGLVLYDPTNSSLASVKLNPTASGVSELPKLKLSNQTLDDPTSVVTQALGDERYVRFSDPNMSVGPGGVSIGTVVNSGVGTSVAIGSTAYAAQDAISMGSFAGWLDRSGVASVSLGYLSGAKGQSSVAIGSGSRTDGENAIALGVANSTSQHGGITIGEGLISNQPGQMIFGAYNQPTVETDTPSPTDNIFIIGNGVSVSARSNAFAIRRNGDVMVSSGLNVTGQTALMSARVEQFLTVSGPLFASSLNVTGGPSYLTSTIINGNLTVSGTLTVGGQSVLTQNTADTRYIQSSQVGGGGNSAILTQDAADSRYMQKGQILRVAPAGDIDMGDFQATPPGVTAPVAP